MPDDMARSVDAAGRGPVVSADTESEDGVGATAVDKAEVGARAVVVPPDDVPRSVDAICERGFGSGQTTGDTA